MTKKNYYLLENSANDKTKKSLKIWQMTKEKYSLPKMSVNDKKKLQFAEKFGK